QNSGQDCAGCLRKANRFNAKRHGVEGRHHSCFQQRTMLIALLLVAGLIILAGNIVLVVDAFRESAVWGLCVLFVPFAALVFVIAKWQSAKRGFLIQLAGVPLILLAIPMLKAKAN